MILQPDQIAALHAGELVEHTINVTPSHKRVLDDGSEIVVRPFSRSRTYAAMIRREGERPKTSCRVHVLSCVHDVPNRRWMLQLKIQKVQQEPARLLKAGLVAQVAHDEDHPRAHGYTDRASEALRHEPEAVDVETQERFSRDAQERHAVFKDSLDEMPLHEQLAYELRRAEELGVDATHTHAAVKRRIRALRRLIEQRAA